MRVSILSIGKFENSPHKAVFETYLKRLKWKVELRELELKNSQNMSVDKIKEGEGALILKAWRPSSKMILLDEKGKQFASRDFAKLISDFDASISFEYGNLSLSFQYGGYTVASAGMSSIEFSFWMLTRSKYV